MEGFLYDLNALVWGLPALVLILGVGLYLTVRLRAVQVYLFPEALRLFVKHYLLLCEG